MTTMSSKKRALPMTPKLLTCLLLTALAGASGVAHAERADSDKPMNIESDALRYDDTRQTSVFTGNVVITKGTIVIRGHQVEVRQDTQGNQFGIATAQSGQRAFYRQKRDLLDEFIEGEAQRIEYDSQADVVKFIGNAVLKRFRGATLADETSGGQIVYNNNTDVFTVDGSVRNTTPANPSGRVRAMLTPAPKPDAPAAPAPAVPGAPLKPSNGLQEAPR